MVYKLIGEIKSRVRTSSNTELHPTQKTVGSAMNRSRVHCNLTCWWAVHLMDQFQMVSLTKLKPYFLVNEEAPPATGRGSLLQGLAPGPVEPTGHQQ